MADLKVLNGGQKITLIETFDNRALILSPGQRLEFDNLNMAKLHMEEEGMEANISWAFGSSMGRRIRESKGEN